MISMIAPQIDPQKIDMWFALNKVVAYP